LVAYGGGSKHGDFTPIEAASSSARVSSEVRRQLTQTKIVPGSAPAPEPVNASATIRDGHDRQAQLSR
jgi:hypothetical protein